MVDIVLALRGQQHRGAIIALSRHALLPLPHEPTHMALDVDIDALAMLPLRARMRRLRALAAEAMAGGLPWQGVMQALRPYGVRLWQSLSPADQARFLRHVVRGWDVHRHRIAPQVVDMLDAMRADGQLRVDAARLAAITADGGQVVLHAAAHGAGAARCWQVDHVVNATGIQSRFPVAGDALQASLLAAGLARPGPFGLGVDVDGDGALRDRHGTAGAHLFAIGSLRIGAEWESIAVPDLRLQAARIAPAQARIAPQLIAARPRRDREPHAPFRGPSARGARVRRDRARLGDQRDADGSARPRPGVCRLDRKRGVLVDRTRALQSAGARRAPRWTAPDVGAAHARAGRR